LSPSGTSRHLAATHRPGRFWIEADIDRQTILAGPVENDPTETWVSGDLCSAILTAEAYFTGRKSLL
jgi:hypothetical protein